VAMPRRSRLDGRAVLLGLAVQTAGALALAAPRMSAATLSRPASAATPVACPEGLSSPMLESFAAMFQGHFDNFAQVEQDRADGLLPRHGGGHEHIHCHVQPVGGGAPATGERFALASYYFDNEPEKLFRERLYAMSAVADDPQFGRCVQMRILELRAETEAALREAGGSAAAVEWSAADAAPELVLPGCDVFWRPVADRFEGRMRTESVVVQSARLGMPIVVRDDVTLWGDALWVNDRGADTEGNYLYGNVRDVPYKMDRQ